MTVEHSVVITGASTGIGRACALHMDELGWRTFAGVRKKSDAAALRRLSSERLSPLFIDVSDARAVHSAVRTVSRTLDGQGLSGLVNNAGVAYGGPVEFLNIEAIRRAFDVNFLGVIRVTQAFLPLLRLGRGRIINMSSISGWVASPFLSPYSASKFAVEALSDAMRVELQPWNIKVAAIEPGAIDTPIWAKGAATVKRLLAEAPPDEKRLYSEAIGRFKSGLMPHGSSPDPVAQAVAHALTSRRPQTRYPIGRDGRLGRLFRLLPDGWRDRLFLARLRSWG